MQTSALQARRNVIADRLARGAVVAASALALEFEVSEDAIRRDLRALANDGLCRRVHGGAHPVYPQTHPMAQRIGDARRWKEALARVAAETIRPGELIFIDSGSTNLTLTEFIPLETGIRVATNSIDIASAVLRRPDLRLIMIGGAVDSTVGGTVDAAATHAVAGLDFARCFLGACAISLDEGVGAAIARDATFKRALKEASRQITVLALNEKFSAPVIHRVCNLSDVNLLVVESDAEARFLGPIQEAGIPVLRAAAVV